MVISANPTGVDMKGRTLSSWQPQALALMRVVVGFIFSQHGLQKLMGFFGGHQADAFTLIWTAGLLETVGGILVMVGLFTRPAAFVLSGEMAVAYFKQHAPGGFWPILNHGELAVLYCFVYLYLVAAGGGQWSLDVLCRRRD